VGSGHHHMQGEQPCALCLSTQGGDTMRRHTSANLPPRANSQVHTCPHLCCCHCCSPTWLQWEKVKKVGMAPGARSSFSLVTWRGQAFMFGGASDNEAKVSRQAASHCYTPAQREQRGHVCTSLCTHMGTPPPPAPAGRPGPEL
jgi:hypothetical protein